MQASEEKILDYLKRMFPGYAFCKTSGNGIPDYMGAPPTESELPTIFVESKQRTDRLRESQKDFAESEVGLRYRKYVCYTPALEDAQCFLYPWDDWLLFVEQENCVARVERKKVEADTLGHVNLAQEMRNLLIQTDVQAIADKVKELNPSVINTEKGKLRGPYGTGGSRHEQLGCFWVFLNLSGAEKLKLMEIIRGLLRGEL